MFLRINTPLLPRHSSLKRILQSPFNPLFLLSSSSSFPMALLKAVHVSDVPNLDQVPENTSSSLYSSSLFFKGNSDVAPIQSSKFMVIGHRGNGMNMLYSSDQRMKAIKENSILSFNAAGKFPLDFVEFDVQVTRDHCPIVFHDDFILTQENGTISERRTTELTLAEFLSYGPQRELKNMEKTLLRKAKDGKIFNWEVENDDSLCTLQEVFQKVDSTLGFNIELKFDDHNVYQEEEIIRVLQAILRVVFECAGNGRRVIFSTFHPDAAVLVRKLQDIYPVFFLTDGGSEIYPDARRNSLDEAMNLCLTNGLQGIVSEVKGIFQSPGLIAKIKESNLSLLSYGQLNNIPEAVYMQHLMGVDGVIVDLVQEITEAVCDIINPYKAGGGESEGQSLVTRPNFSQRELSFLLKLIPELVQN